MIFNFIKMEQQTKASINKDMAVFAVILFLFFASFAALFGVSIYELTKKEPDRKLLFIGEEDTQLQITSEWTQLYNFYTKNVDPSTGPLKGEYVIILNSSSGVDFRVVDENGNVMGSSVVRGSGYVENSISWNSGGKNITNAILQYKSTHNAIVSRIEINID